MAVKDRIKKLGPYFKEMQITNVDDKQVIYVIVEFPNGWVIADDLEEKYKITISEGEYRTEYYFCTDIENGEDSVFDAIDENIERMKEAIERSQLLSEKIKELRRIFEDEKISLQELKNLKIEIGSKDEILPFNKKKENKNEISKEDE
jgi:hypothetical protein